MLCSQSEFLEEAVTEESDPSLPTLAGPAVRSALKVCVNNILNTQHMAPEQYVVVCVCVCVYCSYDLCAGMTVCCVLCAVYCVLCACVCGVCMWGLVVSCVYIL